jgi:hypothetical protein
MGIRVRESGTALHNEQSSNGVPDWAINAFPSQKVA